MIEKHAAIFVTEKTSLIALEESKYHWEEFSWVFDEAFLSFLSERLLVEPMPKIKMGCNNAQIPTQWLRGQHYMFTFHEWVALCQRFIRNVRFPEGDEVFTEFRRYCLRESKDRVEDLVDALNGLFRVAQFDVFVVLSTTKPHWFLEYEGKTSTEYMKEEWQRITPDIDKILKEIMEQTNEIDTDPPE